MRAHWPLCSHELGELNLLQDWCVQTALTAPPTQRPRRHVPLPDRVADVCAATRMILYASARPSSAMITPPEARSAIRKGAAGTASSIMHTANPRGALHTGWLRVMLDTGM